MMKQKANIGYAILGLINAAIMLILLIIGLLIVVSGIVTMDQFSRPWEFWTFIIFLLIMECGGICLISLFLCFFYQDMCTIIIDEKGVVSRNLFHEEHLKWDEIRDYGFIETYPQVIYFSGRRFPVKVKRNCDILRKEFGKGEKFCETVWLPALIQKKRNQKKEDIVITFKYTSERWEYICSMTFYRKELLEKYLEELEND